MARARNIKPGFFTNDQLAEIHPLGRLLFVGLWTIADRAGRLEDRPKMIKAQVLPYDNANADRLLGELADRGFIHRYQVNGVRYIQIINFGKHQNPHIKEHASTIPAPVEHGAQHGASTVQEPGQTGTSPADSLLLIPDSLDKGTVGQKPDVAPLRRHAEDLLGYLNEVTGRSYKPLPANLDLIVARLREGSTPEQIGAVIKAKVLEWRDNPDMAKYLRPATLFNRQKFAQYSGEVPQPGQGHRCSWDHCDDAPAIKRGSQWFCADHANRASLAI
jgi:uncharacterized phage protein (TIGR02220 family)